MKKTILKVAFLSTAMIGLSACGSMNSIDKHGNIKNQDVKWGQIEKSTFKQSGVKGGLEIREEQLKLLRKGQGKSPLYHILGRPHYDEGLIHVREWNYDLNVLKNSGEFKECKLKITFDSKQNAQQFIFKPADCIEEMPQAMPEPEMKTFTLRSDLSFDFNKSDLKAEGVKLLNEIATQIKKHDVKEVVIVGHTDKLGSEKYNQKLSEQRAKTVANYLKNSGISTDLISAYGAGESYPVKECHESNKEDLKACLSDNRRVEISIR